MTHVTDLVFSNYGPFRGEHHVKLGPGAHAVMARREDDPERSNWCGKSWFLHALPLVLFGEHLASTEDGLITRGEASFAVGATLSDGLIAERSRARGKSTQLRIWMGDQEAGGPQAEQELQRRIGMSRGDFLEACFIRQKQIAGIVAAGPASLVERVTSWLRLDLGERCIAEASTKSSNYQAAADTLNGLLDSVKADLTILAQQHSLANDDSPIDDVLSGRLVKAREAQADAESALEAAVKAAEQAGAQALAAQAKQAFVLLDAEGKALRKQLDDLPVADDQAAEELRRADAEHSALAGEMAQLEDMLANGFDGMCPVMRQACPAHEVVDASVALNTTRAAELDARMVEVDASYRLAGARCAAAKRAEGDRQRLEGRLEAMRAQAVALKAKAKGAGAAVAQPDIRAAQQAASSAAQQASYVAGLLDRVRALEARREELEGELAVARQLAMAAGLAEQVLERAQVAVASAGCAEIEEGANALIGDAGIALTVSFSWSRDAAKGLATSCEQCGSAFPKSQRVKLCATCGATRGQKVMHRPRIELSNVSGAAEDIAGVGIMLSASAKVRAQAGAQLAVACIDEPFGALDAANRRALAAHLVSMLGGRYGFEQSFVVAHQQDVLDALPGRVQIVAGSSGSRFE